MNQPKLFLCLWFLSFSTSSIAQSNRNYETEVRNEKEIIYDKNCLNSIHYDKVTKSICKNGFYYINHYAYYPPTLSCLLELSIYGYIYNGKRDLFWNYTHILSDSNGNTVKKYEYYKDGLLQSYNVELDYKETDSAIKLIYESRFKNGTGYYKDYNRYGKVIAEGNYKDGCKDKWWKYYNDKGYLIRKEKYNKGVLKKTLTYQPKE